jgi:hypothetical protein
MTYFDDTEGALYWGNTTDPIIGESKGRLTARSVKMFGDGEISHESATSLVSYETIRCSSHRWCSSKFLISIAIFGEWIQLGHDVIQDPENDS